MASHHIFDQKLTKDEEKIMKAAKLIPVAILTIMLAACAGSPTQESTGEYIDDVALTAKAKSKLLAATETSGTSITIETFKGTVQLSGFVDSEAEKQRAEEIVAAIDGVASVDNKISVKSSY